MNSTNQYSDRYRHEGENVIVEIGVKSSRQLFNEHDPAPFRERDLDHQFVTYIVSAIEEFPILTKMKIRILSAEENDLSSDMSEEIRAAIRSYFEYESTLAKSKLRKRHRTARYFFLIGIVTLFLCMSAAQWVSTIPQVPGITNIASMSFVIIGWVAMWHPIEALLYEWWPIREQRRYFDKISRLDVEIVSAASLPLCANQNSNAKQNKKDTREDPHPFHRDFLEKLVT